MGGLRQAAGRAVLLAEQDVRGLDVAVDDTFLMRLFKTARDRSDDHNRLGQVEGSPAN